MKSVWIGMALLTGHTTTLSNQRHAHSKHVQSAKHAEDALQSVMQSCLALAASAFTRYDKDGSDALNYDEFIEWARSNRAFMLQVEQFRLIAEKAIGFEEELSLPDDSDVDSDLDDEAQWRTGTSAVSGASVAIEASSRSAEARCTGVRPAELPAPWIIEPSHPHLASKASLSSTGGALETPYHDVPPPVNLDLEWIYGASGPATRNTCRYLRNGDVVYVVSKYAIVYSPERHRQRFYQGHRSAILCLDVNAAGELIATGDSSTASSAPEIHIWHGTTLQCLAVLQNFHVDGVAHVSFPAPASAASSTMHNTNIATGAAANLNSNLVKKRAHTEWLVASVGSDANSSMALWDWQHGKLLASGRAHHKTTKRVLAMILNEDATEVLVCGARFVLFHQLDGRFFKHKKPQHMESKLKTVPTCVTAAYYGADLAVVGTSQGQLFQFHRHKLTKIVQAHASGQSVNACLLSCRSMVIFTAGKDGHVKQWDSTLSPIGNPLDLHALLAQSSSDRARAVLASDDLRISSLAYDAGRHKFLVGTRMGHILELSDDNSNSNDHVDGPHVRVLASSHDGHAISCVAMARTGVHFASCGAADKSLALWSLRRRMAVQRLRLKFAPSAIAFSTSSELLAVGGRDGSVLLLESTPPLRARAAMKNTNSAVTALRFAPQDDVLAVACANGLVYLYTLDDSGRKFKRYALLKPFETEVRDGQGQCAATSLDFSIDSAFLKSEHGDPRSLRFWDLRQRACERVTAMNVVRNAVWHTYTSTVGWHVSGLQRTGASSDALTCVEASASQTLLLSLDARGKLALTHFPCAAARDPTEQRVWLEKAVDDAHCIDGARHRSESRSRPSAGFALNDSIVLSTSCHDGVICQWRVEKELRDVQPRAACAYDATMMALLAQFGLEDVYFGWTHDAFEARTQAPWKTGPTVQVAVSDASLQHAPRRTEAPDLDLTLAYVYGMNIARTALNQGLACAGGNGDFVYAAGTLVVIDHVGQRKPQRALQSGLAHAVACLVKHAMHPLVALGSREDNKVVVWHLETQRKVAELSSGCASATLITVAFDDASSSEGDLAAAVWKSDAHVHSLVFYVWRQQNIVARAHMTRLPVLFGFFCSDASNDESPANIQTFVTGGVDHLTLWRLDTACGHVQSQQGVFGRHALVQTLVCGVFVRPFVLTGTTSGAVIVWENGVAAHTVATPPSTPSSTTHNGASSALVTLLHVPSTRQVIGAMQNGVVAVWQYAKHSSNAPCRASTFLDLALTLDVFALEWRYLSSSANSLRSAEPTGSKAPAAHVRSLYLLEETNGVLAALSNGHVVHIDAKLLAHDSHSGKSQQVRGAARVVLEHNQSQRDVAVHPRDFVFATCAASGSVCVWSLHTNTLMKQRDLSTGTCALAYSSAGDRLAVSRADGNVSVLDARSLETVADFACGRPATQTNGNALVPPKWCSTLRYSPVGSSSSHLALGCRDFSVYVYAFTTSSSNSDSGVATDSYALVHEFVGHTARIDALDFSLDGLWLQSSTSSLDAQVLRWCLRTASEDERVATGSCALADDAWSSWTNTFAGPVAGLSELYGSTVTALDRIQRDDAILQATESPASGASSTWSSVLPTMAVGTETGALLLCWYPLPVGDAHQSLAKEYVGFLPRDASVERVAFSFANAYVVACARNYCGEAVVLVWKTDFDDELRQLERNAVVSAVPGPSASSTLVHLGHSDAATAVDTQLFELDPHLTDDVSAGDEFLAVKPWLGAIREPSVVPSDAASGALPDHDLALEFVYGVNAGATASNNVFYADDAWEIVYAAAAVGIVYNTKTQTQLFNQGHQRHLISAMAVHPKGDLVATGECGVRASPKLVLWDANSGSTIAQVATPHRRGIRLLAFAPSGDTLVSIGMEDDHAMSVFSVGSGDGITKVKLVVSVKTSKQPVWNVCFSDESGIVTCGKQHILFWTPLASGSGSGAWSMKKALFTSHKLCRSDATVLAVAPFIKQQVVSSQADGSLYVWRDRRCVDVKLQAHAGAIPTLAVDRKKQLVYSGGSDGKVCVWNATLECVRVLDLAHIAAAAGVQPALTSVKIQSLCVRDGRFLIATAGGEVCELLEPSATPGSSLPNAGYRCLVHVRGHSRGELWGLATHPSKLQFATAGDDGYVRLWDAPTRSLLALHAWTSGGLPRAVAFSSDGTHAAVGSSDGYVRVLTGAELETVVVEWRCTVARGGGVRSLAYSPDGAWLAVGGHDQRVHIFDAHTYKKHGECRGHSSTVTHLDFSKDARVLQSAAAGAGELRFWNVRALAPIASASDVRDVVWATWSCPFGWPVQGIWPPGSDGSDINAVARSEDQRVLATGDDDGLVRLLRYPSATPSAQARAYTGHASHVTNCAFTKSDMFLLSTGGRDQSVCQFKVTLPRA